MFRAAARAGIIRPKTLTADECAAGVASCHKLIKEKESEVSQLRREHLDNRYELASDLKHPAKCIKIKEIINCKDQQDVWRRIKWATGDPQHMQQTLYNKKKGVR